MPVKRKQYEMVDLIKFLFAITIVCIHTGVPILKIIGRIGVPFFVIISAFLFFSKYNKIGSNEQKEYLKKYEIRILKLYLGWQIIYLPFAYKMLKTYIQWNGIGIRQFIKYLYLTFFYRDFSNTGWGTSWYLFAVMYALPLFILIIKYLGHKAAFIISIITELYYILSQGYAVITHIPIISPFFFPRVFIYLFIGYFFAVKGPQIEKKFGQINLPVLSIIFICLFIGENYLIFKLGGWINTEEVITTAPTAFVITLTAMMSHTKVRHHIEYRTLSTFIYTSQLFAINISNRLFGKLLQFDFSHWYYSFPFSMVTIFVMFLLWSYLLNKCHIKILRYLI